MQGVLRVCRVLIVHRDAGARDMLGAMVGRRHEVEYASDYTAGVKAFHARRPNLVIAGQDGRHGDAMLLLRHFHNNGVRVPVIMVAGRGAGVYQQAAMKLGAKAFLEFPVEERRLADAIEAALAGAARGEADVPPLTKEEARANLSELEKRLNERMKCFAGRNLVYLQSYIGSGAGSRPRICLKCPLRKEFGLEPNVYYEFIRDVCCHDPSQCEAIKRFEARRTG